MVHECVALVLRFGQENLSWRLIRREAPKVGGWAKREWVEGWLYPALAIHAGAAVRLVRGSPVTPHAERYCVGQRRGKSQANAAAAFREKYPLVELASSS